MTTLPPKGKTAAAETAAETVRTVDQAFTAGKEQLEKLGQSMFRGIDELSGYNKDNVEAVLQAGAIVARGWETIGRHWFAFAQSSVDQSMSAARSILAAKTLRDVVDLQSDFAKSRLDSLVAESTKLSELALKVANEAFTPLNARLNATVEKMQKPLAA